MKILIISQYYPPEPGATSNRLRSFVDAMIRRGHIVTVICEFPNHPLGVLAPEDRWTFFRVEQQGSLRIIRSFVLTFRRKNNIKRLLFYLSFSFSSFIIGLFLRRHDVVLSSSPPPFSVYAAMIIAWIKRSKFVADFRDLLTDAAEEMGVITNKTLLKFGYFLERRIYLQSDLIFTISRYLKNKIENRGGNGRVHLIYNGSDEDIINWKGDINSIRASLGWNDKIVVCYAGLIGLPQNLQRLVPEMANFGSDKFLFVFIGDGPGKNMLVKKAGEMNINNVLFLEHMDREQVIPLIYAADIMMVILEELDLFKGAIPSKFYDCLGAGKPVITNVDGELRQIMDESNTGLFFSLRDKGSFESAVISLAKNDTIRREMGIRGKRLVVEKFLRKNIMTEAISILETLDSK